MSDFTNAVSVARISNLELKPKGLIDRLLSPFAEVRKGEGVIALLLLFNVFLLLTAYYIIKTVREPLILVGGGAEVKSYTGAGQALLLLFLVPAYGAFASRVNRIRLINGVTLFFISNLLLFYYLASIKVPIGVIFYLWVGIFNVMIIAQFWAYANDIYTEEQGKRLFAIIGFGSSLGAILGARIAGWLIKPLGAYQMMLVAAAMLLGCMVLSNWINERERQKRSPRQGNERKGPPTAADSPLGRKGGFQLVLKDRYLLLIALMILMLNLVNTTGEFMLDKLMTQNARESIANGQAGGLSESQLIGLFKADYFFWVNLLGALLQLFAVSRIFKYIGVRGALFFLPVIALGGYSLLAFVPILSYVRIAKILENSTDYSIQNTTRQALFLPTSRDAKYKAKAAIDSFFVRSGDTLSALLVLVGSHLAFTVSKYAVANIVFVFLFLLLSRGIAKEHKQISSLAVEPAA